MKWLIRYLVREPVYHVETPSPSPTLSGQTYHKSPRKSYKLREIYGNLWDACPLKARGLSYTGWGANQHVVPETHRIQDPQDKWESTRRKHCSNGLFTLPDPDSDSDSDSDSKPYGYIVLIRTFHIGSDPDPDPFP